MRLLKKSYQDSSPLWFRETALNKVSSKTCERKQRKHRMKSSLLWLVVPNVTVTLPLKSKLFGNKYICGFFLCIRVTGQTLVDLVPLCRYYLGCHVRIIKIPLDIIDITRFSFFLIEKFAIKLTRQLYDSARYTMDCTRTVSSGTKIWKISFEVTDDL